ncbi:UNVERIFIED_CONTAM: hypothetical protein Sindi_2690600 [Sesamum indicum]
MKAAIKYGRDSVNLDTVVNGVKSKEMDLKVSKPSQNNHEVNLARGRTRDNFYKDDKAKERRCYNCGIKGHYIKDCRKLKRDNKDRNFDEKEKVNNVFDENGEVFTVYEANSVHSVNKFEWLIDSGYTFHMSPVKEIFSNFRYEKSGFVSMANEKKCEIVGLGDVSLNFKEGYRLILKNVRYVPDLSHNLISCAALEDDGLEGRWGKGLMKIMKGSLVVFKVEKKRNLYLCSVTYDSMTASVNECDMTALWHKRLGI